MTLHAVIEADDCWLDRAVVAREGDDIVARKAGDLRRALRRIFAHPRLERLEAERVARDVVAIEQVLGDEDVHHAERECRVGARQEREMLVTLLRREAAVRIDRDQLRAPALRFLDATP